MSNEKAMIIHLIVGLTKMILLHKMSYFTEPYGHSKHKVKVELVLPKYATKSNLKRATHINTSKFAKKSDLAILKLNDYDLDIDKLKIVPIDLFNLSKTVRNILFKRLYMMNWLKKLLLCRLLILVIFLENLTATHVTRS